MLYTSRFYTFFVYKGSDIGLVRSNNEDAWGQLPNRGIFVLADGMGGHAAGEVASNQAISQLLALVEKETALPQMSLDATMQFFAAAIEKVNRYVCEMGKNTVGLRGMGTTLCCVYLHRDGLIYAHVGDSRIYRLRAGSLSQLTRDHVIWVESSGEVRKKSLLTKAIGSDHAIEPMVHCGSLLEGDVVLLCSDGLSDLLTFERIEYILQTIPHEEAVDALITAAKESGGYDNITVALIHIIEVQNESKNLPRSQCHHPG